MIPSESDLLKLKKDQLVDMAKALDLAASGTKNEIAHRIIEHHKAKYEEETNRLEDVLYHSPTDENDAPQVRRHTSSNDDESTVDSESHTDKKTKGDGGNGMASKDSGSASGHHTVFDELPSRIFVAGGFQFRAYLTALVVAFVLMFGYGFQDYYSQNFSFEGSDKEVTDCIHITYYSLGDGNSSDYDPTAQANIDCAEDVLEISPNWWQEEMDAWIQSLLSGASSGGDHTGFIWTQAGIDTMAYLGSTTFNANMSVFGDPVEGDEFSEQHLSIWNGFGASFPGGGNDTIENLLPGGDSPFAIYMPAGIVAYKPTGFLWTQAGIDTMAYLGATTFNANMSVYGDPVAGDVFTEQHLVVWNGFGAMFPGGGNDTIADLLPGGASPFAIYMPSGIVEHAPTGFFWSHPGVPTMSYLGSTTFGANMSVFGDPSPGDVFTEDHLAVWNGFTAAVGGGNDTIESLLPGGDSPFAVYMPSGIVITEDEWTNQTPSVVNASITMDDTSETPEYSATYLFMDNQNGTDNSTVAWYVNGTYAANTTTYSANLSNGTVLSVRITPYDGLYWGEAVEAELLVVETESNE